MRRGLTEAWQFQWIKWSSLRARASVNRFVIKLEFSLVVPTPLLLKRIAVILVAMIQSAITVVLPSSKIL